MKISIGAMREVRQAFERYQVEVDRAELAETTKRTYLQHAGEFVRWLQDDFDPGTRASGSRRARV